MSSQPELRVLTLTGVAYRCGKETQLFFQRQANDPRYCFELFRRAIEERSQAAWDLVYRQYLVLVCSWAQRHPSFPTCGEEAEFLANCAFEKMWGALSAERFARLPDLKSVLRYLQMCVHSAVVDQARLWEMPGADLPSEESTTMADAEGLSARDQALDRADRSRFWEELGLRLVSEQERKVVYGSFVLALKPREIVAEYPGTFEDIGEVYRVKANLLERLRRDPELGKVLGLDA